MRDRFSVEDFFTPLKSPRGDNCSIELLFVRFSVEDFTPLKSPRGDNCSIELLFVRFSVEDFYTLKEANEITLIPSGRR